MIRSIEGARDELKRVAIYCRVSTDKQASKEDSSLDTQKDRLVRYVEDRQRAGYRWELAYEFIEGESEDGTRRGKSGKDLDRPAFGKLMQKVHARLVDVVLFTKMDRVSRSVVDFLTLVEELERFDVKMVSLKEEINTESAAGRVMTTIMIALAQFEREQISERTREKVAWRASKGLPIGPPPLGYEMYEKRYRPLPAEVEQVRMIEQTYLEKRSMDEVIKMAQVRGIRTRNGRTLAKNTVSRILQNDLYIGKIVHGGETFQGQHEAIRDEGTHRRIREILDRNRRRNASGTCYTKKYAYLLQGLVKCGYCGGRMTPKSGLGRGAKPHHYYVCCRANKTAGIDCKRNFLDAVAADRHILGYVKQLTLRDEIVRRLCEERDEAHGEVLRTLRQERAQVKDRLAENRRQATNLTKTIVRMDEDVPETLLREAKALERESGELEATLSRLGDEIALHDGKAMQVDVAGKTVGQLAAILGHPAATPQQIKDILPRFVNHVTWRKTQGARRLGRFEVSLFERPFRADRGRPQLEVADEIASGRDAVESGDPGRNGTKCGTGGRLVENGLQMGSHTTPGFKHPGTSRDGATACPHSDSDAAALCFEAGSHMGGMTIPCTPQPRCAMDPDLGDDVERPPYIAHTDEFFLVYRGRRRAMVSGKGPSVIPGDRPIQARVWRQRSVPNSWGSGRRWISRATRC